MRFAAAICLLVSIGLALIRAIAADEACAAPASDLASGSTSSPRRVLIESWVSYLHSHSLVNIAHLSHLVPFLTVVDDSDGTPCRGATALRLPAVSSLSAGDAAANVTASNRESTCAGDGDCCMHVHFAEVPPLHRWWVRTPLAKAVDEATADRTLCALAASTLDAAAGSQSQPKPASDAETQRFASASSLSSLSPFSVENPNVVHQPPVVEDEALVAAMPRFPLLSYLDNSHAEDDHHKGENHNGDDEDSNHDEQSAHPRWRYDAILRFSLPNNVHLPSRLDPSLFAGAASARAPRVFLMFSAESPPLRDRDFVGGTVQDFVKACESGAIIPITPSLWSARALVKYNIKPVILPHGVDTTVFYPGIPSIISGLRATAKIPLAASADPASTVFLHVGSMAPHKNVIGILHAFFQLSRDYKDVYLILKCQNGIFPSSKYLREIMKTLDSYNAIKPTSRAEVLKRLFVFEHDLPSHMLADVYRMADVYVSASMAEGFNLPVLEAMATGLPVIVPDKGPTAEFVHAPSAVLMPSTIGPMKEYGLDAAVRVEQFQIYRAMLYARLNKAKLKTAAKHKGLRRHVEAHYTWPAIGRRLATILTDPRHYLEKA